MTLLDGYTMMALKASKKPLRADEDDSGTLSPTEIAWNNLELEFWCILAASARTGLTVQELLNSK